LERERGANKSVIRPMALGESLRDCPELSRRSDRFKSLAHISKRGGSITSFAICQHCQNRVVTYRISKSASGLLSTLSHRSLRHSNLSSPRGSNGSHQTCSYRTTSDRGKFRQQICDTRTALRVLWDLDWGIQVLQETVFRSCAQQ
jgi:hypothetical protein